MAKGGATKSKHKQYKRETNIERAAREAGHRQTLRDAKQVAEIIRAARKEEAELETQSRISSVIPPGMDTSGFSHKRWKEAYAYLGYLCSRSDKNPSKFLRLVADILEGKPAYSPGGDWHDSKITKAYYEAFNRIICPEVT